MISVSDQDEVTDTVFIFLPETNKQKRDRIYEMRVFKTLIIRQ